METNHWLDGLDRGCLLRGLLKNIWMVLLGALIAMGGMRFLLTVVWRPVYVSSATYAVMSKSGISTTAGNMSAANEAAVMMTEILQSEVMENRIRETLGEQTGNLQAQVVGNTNMLIITATAENAEAAFQMMQVAMDSFDGYFSKIDSTAVLQKISDARVPLNSTGERSMGKYLLLAAMLGAGAVVVVLLWLHIKADTIQSRRGARKKLDAQVLATLPHEKTPPLLSGKAASFYYRENIYRLRSRLETASAGKADAVVILVTSVAEGEGKSTIAANLALALAEKHKGVLLVDADLRNPALIKILGDKYGKEQGLGELLRKKQLDVQNVADVIGYNKQTNLMTILERKKYQGATDMLSGPYMRLLLKALRRVVKYIVLDVPNTGMFPDVCALTELVDFSLLVVRQDVASACDINDAADMLEQGDSEFLGCVLNDMRSSVGDGYGYGYSYGRGYGYGYGYGHTKTTQGETGHERTASTEN